MSYKGIIFNGKKTDIPKEYLKKVDIKENEFTIQNSKNDEFKFKVEVDNSFAKPSKKPISSSAVEKRIKSVITDDVPNIIEGELNKELNIKVQKNIKTLGIIGRDVVNTTEYKFPLEYYSVENLSTTYGFELKDNGYYVSNNNGKSSSYALCKVSFFMNEQSSLEFEVINFAESNYDFGMFSQIDVEFSNSTIEDSSNYYVYKSFKKEHSATPVTLTYENVPQGEHFITIKYLKDGSGDQNNDSLMFKITTQHSYSETTVNPVIKTITMSDEDKMQFDGKNVATESFVEERLAGVGGSGSGGSSSGSSSGGIKEYVPTSVSDLFQFLNTNKLNILSAYIVFNSNVSANCHSYEKMIEGDMSEAEAEPMWSVSSYPLVRGNSYNYGYKLYPSIYYDGSNVEGNLKLTCSSINGFLDFYVGQNYMNVSKYQFPDVYFDEEGEIKTLSMYQYEEASIPEESINYALCKVCYY